MDQNQNYQEKKPYTSYTEGKGKYDTTKPSPSSSYKGKEKYQNYQDRSSSASKITGQQNGYLNYQDKKPSSSPSYKGKEKYQNPNYQDRSSSASKITDKKPYTEGKGKYGTAKRKSDTTADYEKGRNMRIFPVCVKVWLPTDRPIITTHTWADSSEIKTLCYNIPGKSAEELEEFILLIQANLHVEIANEIPVLRGMLITSKQTNPYSPDSYLRIILKSSENEASLLVIKSDDYIGALKTRDRWFQFEQMEGRLKRIPDIPGAVTMPFLESYPSITKAAELKHELLELNESSLDIAVNSLLSSVHSPTFARGVLVVINIECEGLRNSQILRDIVGSYKIPRNFGSINTARVHAWSKFSRIFYFSVSEGVMKAAVESVFSQLEIERFTAKAMKEVGILKRPTEFQMTVTGIKAFLRLFKEEAENPQSDLWKVLSVD